MATSILYAITALVICCKSIIEARMDYCHSNNYGSNSSHMQFAKELVGTEYALASKFKSLHCCAKGYRTIEWFKDGKPYPWSSGDFILYPESVNQTLYSQNVVASDKGKYSCVVKNGTHLLEHSVSLHVLDSPPNTPLAMYTPKDEYVEVGTEVRLYCEAFVGHASLEDATSDIKWHRVRPALQSNEKDLEVPIQRDMVKTSNEKEDAVGALLHFASVRPEDYGKYVCTVRNNDAFITMPVTLHFKASKQQIETQTATQILIWLSLAIVTMAALYMLWWRCRGAAALRLRTLTEAPPQMADLRSDSLIAFTPLDETLVRSALAPTLERKYHYKLQLVTLPVDPNNWYDILNEHIEEVRSVVVVMSPRQYTVSQMHEAVKQVRALPIPPVLVLLQDLPKLKQLQKDANGETLISLLRKTRVLAWKHLRDRQFWTNLRLALPLPSPQILFNTPNASEMRDLPPTTRTESRNGSFDGLV